MCRTFSVRHTETREHMEYVALLLYVSFSYPTSMCRSPDLRSVLKFVYPDR